jgi:hypothetical protein
MTQTKTNTTSPQRMNEEETHMKAMMYHTDGSPAVLELKEEDRNPHRRTAVLVGVLFLLSTATFILSNVLMTLMLVYLYTALGGLMLSYMLLRNRLVPRWLAVLGLIGYVALLGASVLDMLGIVDTVAGLGLVGLVPGGLFEFLLPIWLFAKGFNLTALARMRVARVSG